MSASHGLALSDLTTTVGTRTVSSRSKISEDAYKEGPSHNPFVDQFGNLTDELSSQPYDPASGKHLLSEGTRQQQHAQSRPLFREWVWELAAWLAAAISLGFLIIVFVIYNGKPLDEWTAGINPATTVAILSQAGQSSMVLLVWLGTVIVLLNIIYGSFAQQALQLPTREFNLVKGSAIMPRTLQYIAPFPYLTQIIPETDTSKGYHSVTDLMSIAITDGLLRPDIKPSEVAGNCDTGNCTWENYQSLGVHATVVDVSSTITAKCGMTDREYHPPGCNYSVPALDEDPTASETVLQATRDQGQGQSIYQTLWMGASDDRLYEPPGTSTLTQFYVIYVPDFNVWDRLDHRKDHKEELVALQVTLALCVNEYHSNMTFGVTNTDLLSNCTELDWQEDHEVIDGLEIETVSVTHDAEKFWMYDVNKQAFYSHLSLQVFTGSAQWASADRPGSRDFLNTSDNRVVAAVAASLNDDRVPGFSELLDNLAVSMSNARRSRIPAWKTSSLAVLFGLSFEARRDLGAIGRPKEMMEKAEKKNVRLESAGGQWQIVKGD
ncbi:MAG: hypothetical protein Q9169_007020 [Polycauliona sp. 2 TL-2023]